MWGRYFDAQSFIGLPPYLMGLAYKLLFDYIIKWPITKKL